MQLGYRRRWTSGESSFWYGSIISVIIRDERYTGKWIYGKRRMVEIGKQNPVMSPKSDWIIVPDAIPAIISQEQFDAANKNADKRSYQEHKGSQSTLLFTRKLKCGHCGKGLKAVHRKNDIKYHCYTAKLTKKYGCSIDDWIFEEEITVAVFAALKKQIALAEKAHQLLDEKAKQVVPDVEMKQNEVTKLQKQIDKLKTVKLDMWEKYHTGAMTGENFQREFEKADIAIKKNTMKIPELLAQIETLKTEMRRENVFIEQYGKLSGLQELTRKVVEDFISEVKVYAPDRIEVIFNFADEYAKIAPLFERSTNLKRT
jgi:hypothetical protein